MSDKYIIKNCPAIYGVFLDGCKKDHYEDEAVLCQDCTDCVMKQIVEKCKRTLSINKGSENGFTLGKMTFAEFILKDLDIQEVE